MRRASLLLWCLIGTACVGRVGGATRPDAAADAGARGDGGVDASTPLDAEPSDAGPSTDAAPTDASPGPTDATASGPTDAAAPDTGMTTDAGPTDTGTTLDAGPTPDTGLPADAGPPPCTALLCDDFEAYPTGAAPPRPWAARTSNGTVSTDDTRAYSGTRSVRFTTAGGTDGYRRAYLELTGAPVFPLPGSVLWGRMMMWVTAAPTGSVHWTHIEAEGTIPGGNVRALYRYGGQHDKRLMANYDTRNARSDCWDHSRTVIPEGRWACYEWRFDSAASQLELWLDGTALTDITVAGVGEGCLAHDLQDRWTAPVFDALRLGWEHYQPSIPMELWVDDVAVGGDRIGCP